MEKPKKKPTKLKKWLIGIGLVLLIAFVGSILFFIGLAYSLNGMSTWSEFDDGVENLRGEEAREAIEAYPVNVQLPEDVQDVYLYLIAWQDMSANIRFSASSESIETWLNGNDLCFTELIPNKDIHDNIGESLDWWTPNAGRLRVASEQCGSYLDTGGFQIAIDQSNPELWIVYLIVMR